MAEMEITVYAKKRQTRDGKKSFFSYLTTLKKSDGSPCTCAVKFAGEAADKNPDPLSCPMNIVVDKQDCNMAVEQYTDNKSGEVKDSYRLWVKKYRPGTPYVDHSMDEFF